MSAQLLEKLIQETDPLSPQEKLRLAVYLVERASQNLSAPQPRRKWREIRGMARPSLFDEDAQAWVSRTRRESDEHREGELRRKS